LSISKNWKPGWGENEENLFPHMRTYFKWDRPEWANNNPKYEGDNWKKIPHEEIDERGCIWNLRGADDNMGHPGRPALRDWKDYDVFTTKYNPDPTERTRYEFGIELKKAFGKDKYIMVVVADLGPFSRATCIRGFSNYLIDQKRNPEKVKMLLKREADYHVKVMKSCFKYGINPHGFLIVDDLGEQRAPFFSPRTFKEFYEPIYRTICNEAHDLGTEIHLHCCGKIDPLLPLLIECGLDSIELDSPRMTGYPDLKPFRGKIMFWGCVNIQSIYTQGTSEECEREVWHMIRNLGTREGGYGAYFYPTPQEIHAPKRNIKGFEKGLKKYGTYSEIPSEWWDYPTSEVWKDYVVPELPPLN